MSRRDTIIIAVLLNAGLLVVLFATSLKTDISEGVSPSLTLIPSSSIEGSSALAVASPARDEVDQVLRQYVPPTPSETPNFAADLQAIGSPSDANSNPLVVAPFAPSFEPTPSLTPSQNAPSSQREIAYKEVTVKKGDVLERIARNNQATVDEIMKANNLSSTRLKIGQVLKVPAKENGPKSNPNQSLKRTETTGSKYYTVKAGDNPWTIAVKNHMKVEELLKLNDLDAEKARRLKAGDQLRIQ